MSEHLFDLFRLELLADLAPEYAHEVKGGKPVGLIPLIGGAGGLDQSVFRRKTYEGGTLIAEAQQYMRTPSMSEYTHCLKFFILDIFRKFGKSIFLLKARASVTGIYKWIKSYS